MEPKAGLEPATTRLTGDNPILRPVGIAGLRYHKLGQANGVGRRIGFPSPANQRPQKETFASRIAVEPAASDFEGRHSTFELDHQRLSAR